MNPWEHKGYTSPTDSVGIAVLPGEKKKKTTIVGMTLLGHTKKKQQFQQQTPFDIATFFQNKTTTHSHKLDIYICTCTVHAYTL